MPTMFHQPYLNKSFNGDFTQLIPPRSASASSCKSSGPFFTDSSKLSSFVGHRTLLPYSEGETLSSQEVGEFGLGRFASRSKKFFNSNCELFEDNFIEGVPSELKAARKPIYSSDDMVLSELLSITRPEGVRSDFNASDSADILDSDTTQSGRDAWFSHQTVQELTDLRSDITPRLFRGPSKKTSLPVASSLRGGNSLLTESTSQEKFSLHF